MREFIKRKGELGGVHLYRASLDPEGRVYVTETHRWRKQIHDNRNVPIRDFRDRHGDWLMEDLACRTNQDRHDMLKRWSDGGKFREIASFAHFSADGRQPVSSGLRS